MCYIGIKAYQKILTVSNIMQALINFSDQWIKIAELLHVPDYVISSILVSRLENDQASLRKVIEWWFKDEPNPEWIAIEKVQGTYNIIVYNSEGIALTQLN